MGVPLKGPAEACGYEVLKKILNIRPLIEKCAIAEQEAKLKEHFATLRQVVQAPALPFVVEWDFMVKNASFQSDHEFVSAFRKACERINALLNHDEKYLFTFL